MPVEAGRRINQQLSSRPSHAITVISHYGHWGPSPLLKAAGMSVPVSLPAIGNPGFPPRLEHLGNESVNEKIFDKIGKRSWNFVISHGIFPISPLNFTKFVHFLVANKKFSVCYERQHFSTFSEKCRECKI